MIAFLVVHTCLVAWLYDISDERPYQCQICHKKYKTNEMLKQHTYKLHTGTPRFECDVCQRKFFYAAELREHKQLHSSELRSGFYAKQRFTESQDNDMILLM